MKNDDIIKNARRSLLIQMDFQRQEKGVMLRWSDKNVFWPCNEGEPTLTAVAVGAIHSLICHNTMAILDNKKEFTIYAGGGEQITLPVYIPSKRDEDTWTYPPISPRI